MNRAATQPDSDPVRLKRPPYCREVQDVRRAGGYPNVNVHVGTRAWDRAKCWGHGNRLVVPLDFDHGPFDYDFGVLDGLTLVLNAIDADLVLARQVAVAIAEQGARLVVLLHPALPKNSEFVYGAAV